MSSIANLVAYDGASTPVAHTLRGIAVGRDAKGVIEAIYRESLTGVPLFGQVNVRLRSLRLPNGLEQCIFRTEVPILEQIAGENSAGYTAAPKVAHINTIQSIGYFDPRATEVHRRLVRQLHGNIMLGLQDSVTPVTSGPLAELFDLSIMPT